MEWGNVTGEELVDALREVEWSSPLRPLTEFFQRFTAPKNYSKWTSRLKCNIYYYRTSYFAIFFLFLVLAFVRRPLALVASLLVALSAACLNDSFAVSLSERIVRGVRRLSPPLAAKMRPSTASVFEPNATSVPVSGPFKATHTQFIRESVCRNTRGRPASGVVHVGGQDRRILVAVLLAVSVLLWYLTSSLLWALGAAGLGISCISLHATFRSPNLKARLNSYREEFRAVWRGYSDVP